MSRSTRSRKTGRNDEDDGSQFGGSAADHQRLLQAQEEKEKDEAAEYRVWQIEKRKGNAADYSMVALRDNVNGGGPAPRAIRNGEGSHDEEDSRGGGSSRGQQPQPRQPVAEPVEQAETTTLEDRTAAMAKFERSKGARMDEGIESLQKSIQDADALSQNEKVARMTSFYDKVHATALPSVKGINKLHGLAMRLRYDLDNLFKAVTNASHGTIPAEIVDSMCEISSNVTKQENEHKLQIYFQDIAYKGPDADPHAAAMTMELMTKEKSAGAPADWRKEFEKIKADAEKKKKDSGKKEPDDTEAEEPYHGEGNRKARRANTWVARGGGGGGRGGYGGQQSQQPQQQQPQYQQQPQQHPFIPQPQQQPQQPQQPQQQRQPQAPGHQAQMPPPQYAPPRAPAPLGRIPGLCDHCKQPGHIKPGCHAFARGDPPAP